jgi:hypothetical protein
MQGQVHPFKNVVDLVRTFVEVVNPDNKGTKDYVPMSHSLASFTKQDWMAMASSPASAEVFSTLYNLKIISDGRSPRPNSHLRDPQKNAADAKAALSELKPANMELDGFLRLIEEVSVSVGAGRARFTPQLQGKRFRAGVEEGASDLRQSGVTLDEEHLLKKPLDKALAGVVQQLKGPGRNS